MNRPHREHPAVLPLRLSLYIWLFLLPLIRGIHLVGLPGDIPGWLRSHLPDRLVALIVVITAVTLWWHRTYTISHRSLILRRGVLIRRTTRIHLSRITTLTVERPLWLRLTGGARVVADTDAGNHQMADLRLLIRRRQLGIFLPDTNRVCFRASGGRILLFSVFSSNSLGGFILLITVLRQGSILLGEGLRQTILDNLESAAEALVLIPKTAAVIALALGAAWLAGTLRLLLRHLPFRIRRDKDTLTIYTGFLTRHIHCCAIEAINYLDRRQTLIACLCGLHTSYISCTGYGKDRNTRALLIPPCRREHATLEERLFLPPMAPFFLMVRPTKGALWRYWRWPLALLVFIPLTGWMATLWLPGWQDLILYLTLIAVLPCLWLLAVRWIDRRTAGLGHVEGNFCLAYSRFLTLHRVTLPQSKVAMVLVRQSPWQRHKGVADVRVYSHHEFRRPHPVKHLPLDEVIKLLETLN